MQRREIIMVIMWKCLQHHHHHSVTVQAVSDKLNLPRVFVGGCGMDQVLIYERCFSFIEFLSSK